MTDAPLFHLAFPDDWEEARRHGRYEISTRGRTLAQEGFIHLSRAQQWQGVRERFYADVPGELLLLRIDPTLVDAPVVEEEPAPGVVELFPHLYGALPVDAVTEVSRLDAPHGPAQD